MLIDAETLSQLGEGLRDLKRTGLRRKTNRVNQPGHLGALKRQNHQPKSEHVLDLAPLPHMWQMCSLVLMRVLNHLLPPMDPIPLMGHLVLQLLDVPRMG